MESIDRLDDLNVGDQIRISERATPMEVTGIRDDTHILTVLANNQYGRYRLRQHRNATISARGPNNQIIAGDVEVTRL